MNSEKSSTRGSRLCETPAQLLICFCGFLLPQLETKSAQLGFRLNRRPKHLDQLVIEAYLKSVMEKADLGISPSEFCSLFVLFRILNQFSHNYNLNLTLTFIGPCIVIYSQSTTNKMQRFTIWIKVDQLDDTYFIIYCSTCFRRLYVHLQELASTCCVV